MELLSTRLQRFELVINYNLFASAENDIYIHRIIKVKKKAQINSIVNAVKIIHKEWGCKFKKCYQNAVAKANLKTAFERAILNWDIQVNHWQIISLLYLFMFPRKLICRFSKISLKIFSFLILICLWIMTVFLNTIKMMCFSFFKIIIQTSSSS